MRKLLSIILVSLLLTSMVSPASSSGYRETAMSYLTEKYGVPGERVELNEGGIMHLDFTAESFWFAKYVIVPEGKSSSGAGEKPLLLPAPEPMLLPAPDIAPSDRREVMPMPPQDIVDDGYIYGGVYIRLKTGEILELDEMEPFYVAERLLAEQEWERLRKEAGKLDVSLYLKLQGWSSTEKITVWIQPAPVETDAIRTQFASIKEKYPELSSGVKLSDFLSANYSYAVPGIRGGGVSSNASDYAVSDGDTPVSYAVPDKQEVSLRPAEAPDVENMPGEDYWREYNAFWEELEQLRIQAVAPSLVKIKEALDGMDVNYRKNESSISADLTAAQITEVAELSAVVAIFEEEIFTTTNDALLARGSDEKAAAPATEAGEIENARSYLLLILVAIATVAAVFIAYRRRTVQRPS